MDKPEFTLGDVEKVFPNINRRTIQVWVKRGVIRPAISSSGQGYPVRFSYLNLIEIGLIWQIVRLGLDSHAYFLKVMEYAYKLRLVGRWIAGGPEDRYLFDCFFIFPEPMAFGKRLTKKEAQNYIEAPPFVLKRPDELDDFFKESSAAGWLLIDIRAIRHYVDGRLASL